MYVVGGSGNGTSTMHTYVHRCEFYMYVDIMKTHKSNWRQLVTRSYPHFQKIVSHSPVVENAHQICLFDFPCFQKLVWFVQQNSLKKPKCYFSNCKGSNWKSKCDILNDVQRRLKSTSTSNKIATEGSAFKISFGLVMRDGTGII